MNSADGNKAPPAGNEAAARYLDLLKQCLTDMIHIDDPMSGMVPYRPVKRSERLQYALLRPVLALLGALNLHVVRPNRQKFFDYARMSADELRAFRHRRQGLAAARAYDGRSQDDSTIFNSASRRSCASKSRAISWKPEYWRGGASIFVKGVLTAHGDTARRVWLADSFRRTAAARRRELSGRTAAAASMEHAELAVSRERVEANFRAYGLLDERVCFLEGWFKDTLPTAPIERLAILRMDGDLYESTIQALDVTVWKAPARAASSSSMISPFRPARRPFMTFGARIPSKNRSSTSTAPSCLLARARRSLTISAQSDPSTAISN